MYWSADKKQEVRDLYAEIKNIREVARRLKVPNSNVKRWCFDMVLEQRDVIEHQRKVIEEKVTQMRKEVKETGVVDTDVYAKKYGLTRGVIYHALRGDTYRHLEETAGEFVKAPRATSKREEVRALYKDNFTYAQIKEKLNIPLSSISLWCSDIVRGPRSKPKRKVPQEVIDEARRLYKTGLTPRAVGKLIKFSDNRITKWCADLIKARREQIGKTTIDGKEITYKKLDISRGRPVLVDDNVIEARLGVRKSGKKQFSMWAKKFGVANTTMALAIKGSTFKHLDPVVPPITEEEAVRGVRVSKLKDGKMRVHKRKSTVEEPILIELIALRRSDPERWTYSALAKRLSYKTGKHYVPGPVAILLTNRDPSLKLLESNSPRVRGARMRVQQTPEQIRQKLQAAYRRKQELAEYFAEDERRERELAARTAQQNLVE